MAQDRAQVLAPVSRQRVPHRHFKRTLLIGESAPLEPKVLDLFFVARGVGLELVRFKRGE